MDLFLQAQRFLLFLRLCNQLEIWMCSSTIAQSLLASKNTYFVKTKVELFFMICSYTLSNFFKIFDLFLHYVFDDAWKFRSVLSLLRSVLTSVKIFQLANKNTYFAILPRWLLLYIVYQQKSMVKNQCKSM